MTRPVLPDLVLVLYEFGHMGNLVLTFEGVLSKVMGNHFARFWNSGQKEFSRPIPF